MSVSFEIDKARQDSFYHYRKYNDDSSVCVKTGWGIWSNQGTEEERGAWLSAVQKYQNSRGVKTKKNIIHESTDYIREKIKLDNSKFDKEKKSLIMPTITDLISAMKSAGTGECMDDYINKVMGLTSGGIPSPKAIFQYSWNAAWFNLEIDLQEMLMSYTNLGISAFVYPVLDYVDSESDKLFGTASTVYDEILRVAATAVYYYNRLVKIWGKKDKEEEAEAYKKKLLDEIKALGKKYGEQVVEVVYQIFTIQVILDMLQVIKTGYNSAESAWRGAMNKIRSLTGDDFKDMCKPCWEFLKKLLPLLAALAGAYILCKRMNKAESEQSLEMSAENLGVEPDKVSDYLNEKAADARSELLTSAVVYEKAFNKIDNFSLEAAGFDTSSGSSGSNAQGGQANQDSSVRCDSEACDCKVSMCNFSDPVDASAIISRGTLEFPAGVVIEIQKDLQHRFTISAGAEVKPGDVIAYIKDVPVKSAGGYKISEVRGNYIIGYEILDDALAGITTGEDAETWAQNMLQQEIDNADLTEYNKITDAYTKFSYADIFIRHYMSY